MAKELDVPCAGRVHTSLGLTSGWPPLAVRRYESNVVAPVQRFSRVQSCHLDRPNTSGRQGYCPSIAQKWRVRYIDQKPSH